MLTVIQQFLVRPTLYSISLTFKCQSTAVVLVGLLVVAGRVLGNGSVCPSGCFFGISLSFSGFSEFRDSARNSYEVVYDRARFFEQTFLAPKIGELGQK